MVTGDSVLNCNQCNFTANYAQQSSAIHASSNEASQLSISLSNSQFSSNTHDDSLITQIGSNAIIVNTTFIDNIASRMNYGITQISSSLIASNISVNYQDINFLRSNQWTVDTGFFSLSSYSSILLNGGSIIQNCRGAMASVLQATGQSSVIIDQKTKLINCQSQSGGSTLLFQMANSVQILNSLFQGNSDLDLIIRQSSVNIVNTTFIQTQGQSINAQRANLTIFNSIFKDSQNQYLSGKALYCNCFMLTINNCTFQNLLSLEGGALYLTSSSVSSVFVVSNSIFTNNTAMHGGAIKLQDSMQLNLYNNTFTGNQAIVFNPPNMYSAKFEQSGLGGALNLDCNNVPMKMQNNCQVTIGQGNIFSQNTASDNGGAMVYFSNPPLDDGTNIYLNNSAQYAADSASYPKSLQFDFLDNNDILNRSQSQPNASFSQRVLQNQVFPTLVSGTPFTFLVYILDQQGKLFSNDNSSIATLTSSDPDTKLSSNLVVASGGIYHFKNVTVVTQPGSSTSLVLAITGINSYGNPVPFVQTPSQIQVQTRLCGVGESFTEDNKCVQCDSNSFLLYAPTDPTQCEICPLQAQCYGGNNIAPAAGYWRQDNETSIFLECPNKDACLAGSQTQLMGVCAQGYTGMMCSNCLSGYRRSSQQQCSQCPTFALNALYLLILVLISLFIIWVLIRAILLYEQGSSTYSVLLKIIVSHFHGLGIIMTVNFNWPAELQKVQNGYGYFSGVSQEIFSFDCFLQTGGFAEIDLTTKNFSTKLMFFAVLPLVICVGITLLWVFISLIRRNFSDIRIKILSSMIVIFYLILPSIATTYFATFNCINVEGIKRMREDLSTICFQGNHLMLVVAIAFPAIVIWLIGMPVLSLWLLFRNNQTIKQIHQSQQLSKADQKQIEELRLKYGYFFTGFRTPVYFWELVIILRKILLIMVTVFLTVISSETQVLVSLIILILFTFIHLKFHPYSSKMCNRMELYSLQVITLTMYAGMFYVTGQHYQYMEGNGIKWFFVMLILLPNFAFFAYWLKQMRIQLLKLSLIKSKLLFKFITCGLIDSETFLKDNLSSDDEDNPTAGKKSSLKRGVTSQPNSKSLDDFDGIRKGQKKRNMSDTLFLDSNAKKYKDDEVSGPNYDTDKSSSSKPQNKVPKLNLPNHDFMSSMVRKIGTPLEDELAISQQRSTTTQNRLVTNGDAVKNTSRDKQSYRKVFPEQVLTQRGDRTNEYSTNTMLKTDRSMFDKKGGDDSMNMTSRFSARHRDNQAPVDHDDIEIHMSVVDQWKINSNRKRQEEGQMPDQSSDYSLSDIEKYQESIESEQHRNIPVSNKVDKLEFTINRKQSFAEDEEDKSEVKPRKRKQFI